MSGTVCSFPPIESEDARVLILGTMPSAASLAAGQYYAHRRNAFWPIMGALFGATPELPYSSRVAKLRVARVAVWDVLMSCVRPGSLDSAIDPHTEIPNDVGAFLAAHDAIDLVVFNGRRAEAIFRRRVLATIAEQRRASLRFASALSTSPAHAARSVQEKQDAWRRLLAGVSPALTHLSEST